MIGLGLGALSSIPQWITGYSQGNRADQLANGLVRPEFKIPQAEEDALASAKAQAAMTQLPGQAAIEGRLDQTTANTVANIQKMGIGGSTAINGAGVAYGNQLGAENNLGIAGAQMRLNNQQILRDQEGKMADWEGKQQDWNTLDPYMQKVNTIQALREGQIRNENSAWKNLFGMGANFFGGMAGEKKDNMDWLNGFGGGSNGMSSSQADPSSPFFKTDFGTKPLFDKFQYGLPQ